MVQQFIVAVNNLASGTVFEITIDWLKAHGKSALPGQIRYLGRWFASNYATFNCILNGTGTDNHKSYTKSWKIF